MWAAGCILAELLALRPLFQGEERKQPGTAFQADQCDKCAGFFNLIKVQGLGVQADQRKKVRWLLACLG